MVIVAGSLEVDADGRAAYLDGCVEVVSAARHTPGCLDFAISADPVDPCRINIFERWESQSAVEAFRGDGVREDQGAAILSAVVAEYDVADIRVLAGESG
ncbi:putative quinol monooxygenase [Gordonia sp. 'Campus']|uniref:putative quinol monooxygenase n=1 Tax=Gordonia sp. 'Campus' TaxID=2915824 RepID=UPI001EE4730E|nr:antibiotic biosynthesis monooxygenase [Gordonia sp. 'Campus']